MPREFTGPQEGGEVEKDAFVARAVAPSASAGVGVVGQRDRRPVAPGWVAPRSGLAGPDGATAQPTARRGQRLQSRPCLGSNPPSSTSELPNLG